MGPNSSRKRNVAFLLHAVLFLFYLWLAHQIPYTHDDWDWGTANGMQYLLHATLNSRYAGNLVEVAVTRSVVFKDFLLATVLTAIPAVVVTIAGSFREGRLSESEAYAGTLLGHAMILLMPVWIWQQTNGWIAGFSNYTVSALFILLSIRMLMKVWRQDENNGIGKSILAFLLTLVTQLFLENVTVVFTFIMVVIVLADRISRKTWNRQFLLMFAGCCMGCVIMFSSGIYSTLMTTGVAVDGYRHFTFERDAGIPAIIEHVIKYFLTAFPGGIWSGNTLLCCTILAVLAVRAAGSGMGYEKKKPEFALLMLADVLFILYFVYIRHCGEIQLADERTTNHLSAGMSWLYFVLCALQIILMYREKKQLLSFLLGIWIAAPLVVFPMAAVSGADGRTFFTPYILEVLFLTVLFLDLPGKKTVRLKGSICVLASLLFVTGLIRIVPVYTEIGRSYRRQKETIKTAEETGTAAVIEKFPHEEWIWLPEPQEGSVYVEYYRSFYHVPEHVELSFEAWEQAE